MAVIVMAPVYELPKISSKIPRSFYMNDGYHILEFARATDISKESRKDDHMSDPVDLVSPLFIGLDLAASLGRWGT